MTPGKRFLDLFLAIFLSIVLIVPFLFLLVLLLLVEGRPLFYVAERMKTPNVSFRLWKLRTMRPGGSTESGVSGGDKAGRVGRIGGTLRKLRLDEIPQLWNVLRGDMSFVGPRPPLREYVERFPQVYDYVLRSRPGITGLASLHIHRYEERVLTACRSAEETDAAYARRCIPKKMALDLAYQRNANICFDIKLLWQTAMRVMVARRK